jgi:hypothetical protein
MFSQMRGHVMLVQACVVTMWTLEYLFFILGVKFQMRFHIDNLGSTNGASFFGPAVNMASQ